MAVEREAGEQKQGGFSVVGNHVISEEDPEEKQQESEGIEFHSL